MDPKTVMKLAADHGVPVTFVTNNYFGDSPAAADEADQAPAVVDPSSEAPGVSVDGGCFFLVLRFNATRGRNILARDKSEDPISGSSAAARAALEQLSSRALEHGGVTCDMPSSSTQAQAPPHESVS